MSFVSYIFSQALNHPSLFFSPAIQSGGKIFSFKSEEKSKTAAVFKSVCILHTLWPLPLGLDVKCVLQVEKKLPVCESSLLCCHTNN